MLNITVQDNATPDLIHRLQQLGRQGYAVMGYSVAQLIKRHLINRNQQPNKYGWPKQNYYGRAAESVFSVATTDTAEVHIGMEGFRVRYEGSGYLPDGSIKPINAKALTIPLRPEAYGKRAREFSDLFMLKFAKDAKVFGALYKRGTAEPYYLLVNKVTQSGDSTVLPPQATILQTAIQAIAKLWNRRQAAI